jgi:hypothetical protein
MIDRCDDEIATWSESGENFVVKNVEKFACVSALPRYTYTGSYEAIGAHLHLTLTRHVVRSDL